jgi:hypothetical protein
VSCAAITAMPRIQPTDEQLQAAFARLRRPSWPATLAAALANPLHAALLRGDAVRHAMRPAAPPPAPPARHLPLPRSAAHFDRKRAASGERDDD